MQWLRTIPTLYYVAVFFIGLAFYLRDRQCLYLAGACVVIGFLQQSYHDKTDGSP